MAFTPTSGLGGYIGTPKAKRPYTSQRSRPPDVPRISTRVRIPSNPQGPSRPPDVPVTPQAPQTPAGQTAGPSTGATATAAAQAGAAADGMEAYLAGITDPQERAYVAAQIGPKIAALRAQQAALTEQLSREAQIIQGLNAAMAGQISGLSGILGDYGKVGGIQKGSGKAEKGQMQKVGKGENAETQAVLGAIGAPGEQSSQLSGLSHNIFDVGGDVLKGIGGDIPAWATGLTGGGVAAWLAAQPTLAAAYGQETMRQLAMQEAGAQSDLANQIGGVVADIPGIRQDYMTQQQKTQQEAEDRATRLYNAGMITQRQYAVALGLPNPNSYPDTMKGAGTGRIITYTDPSTGIKSIYNLATGKSIVLPGQHPRVAKEPVPKAWQSKQINNKTVLFNPNDGTYHDPVTKALLTTLPGKAPGQAVPDLSKSIARGIWVDKFLHPIPELQGTPVPPRWKPGKTGQGVGAGGMPTVAEKKAAITYVQTSFPHAPGSLKPMTIAEIDAKLQAMNQHFLNAWKARGGKIDADGTVHPYKDKKTGLPVPPPPPFTRASISTWSPAQKRKFGLDPNYVPSDPQTVYMQLIRKYSIPARMARDMVAKYYPGFGADYFPKDSAPQSGAYKLPATATSEFGTVDKEGAPDASGTRHHAAYDWMLGAGAAVPALVAGKVIEAKPSLSNSGQVFGGTVKILTPDGKVLVYRHVAPTVKVGDTISSGQPVANVVRWADSPGSSHTHVEYWKSRAGGYRYENMLDPVKWFAGEAGAPKGTNTASGPWDPNKGKTSRGAIKLAQAMALNYGWSGKEWSALYQMWNKESGFDYKISNTAGSGAVGIPQRMPSSHPITDDYLTNPVTQIQWGLDYIKNRYHTPSRAWAFWRATVNRNASLAPPDLQRTAQTWIANGWAGY